MRQLLFSSLLFASIGAYAQTLQPAPNLVPNPSMEQYTTCPTDHSQAAYCTGWFPYTIGTPDYFNACSGNPLYSVPNNMNGSTQTAAGGNAYMGLFTRTNVGDVKEYISTNIPPLAIGEEYEVSIMVSLSELMGLGTNDLGVHFIDKGPATIGITTTVPVIPKVSYSGYGPITDKVNWVTLKAVFTADSAYKQIVVGGFKTMGNQTTATAPGGGGSGTYYYVDSVAVRLNRKINIGYVDTIFCPDDTISVPYTLQGKYFNSGNTFTLQMSDASGSFAAPIVLGTLTDTAGDTIKGLIPYGVPAGYGYKIRIKANAPNAISEPYVLPLRIKPSPAGFTATSDTSSVCIADTIRLYGNSASSPVTYQWTGPNGFSAFTKDAKVAPVTTASAGDYILKATYNGCSIYETVTISTRPLPTKPALSSNAPLCPGQNLNLFTATFMTGATYVWSGPGGYTSTVIYPTRSNVSTAMSGDYVLKATYNGCSDRDTINVLIYPPTPKPTATVNNPVCVGGDIQLAVTGASGSAFEWSGPNGFTAATSTVVKPNAALKDGGVYSVTAKLNGCFSEPDTETVSVIQGPSVLAYPNPGDTICSWWTVSFVAVPKNAGAGATFAWYRNGTPVGVTTSTYHAPQIQNGDSVYVRMTAATGCNTPITSKAIRMTVLEKEPPPTINITADPGSHVWPDVEVTFRAHTGNAGAHPGYQWRRNGVDIPDSKDSILKTTLLKTGDTICCIVSSNFLCADPRDVAACMVMNVDLGVDYLNKEDIKLYPNPTAGTFVLEAPQKGNLVIYDTRGATIGEYAILRGSNNIALPQLSAGIYMGKFMGDDGKITMLRIVHR